MKLGTRIYSAPGKGQKCIQVRYNPDERYTHAINWTGFAYADTKFKLIWALSNSVVVTDSDLCAHADYIDNYSEHTEIVLVFQAGRRLGHYRTNAAFGPVTSGASLRRLRNAKEILKRAGIKVKLFLSERACLNYLARKKQ